MHPDERLSPAGDPGRLAIRQLTASDRPALAFVFRRLGDRSRYQRFLGIKTSLSSPELDRLTSVDHWHHEALIACSPTPRTPIGVARYARCEQFDLAELAVTVADDWQRRGVGRTLLTALRAQALHAGIRRFTATLLSDNHGALALAKEFDRSAVIGQDTGEAKLMLQL
jgi:RimJ/RimL family protein N-acetyltransferase